FGLAENTNDLFVGKTLLHGDVLMWLMKTLLTSRCVNQRGAGHRASSDPGSFWYSLDPLWISYWIYPVENLLRRNCFTIYILGLGKDT
ncbi:hypothetical protein CFM95_27165, partial [Klebsiella michiganensis]|nr:hypothetical protein [Klebsiella michiganensis]